MKTRFERASVQRRNVAPDRYGHELDAGGISRAHVNVVSAVRPTAVMRNDNIIITKRDGAVHKTHAAQHRKEADGKTRVYKHCVLCMYYIFVCVCVCVCMIYMYMCVYNNMHIL
jgi:hypothetical protein